MNYNLFYLAANIPQWGIFVGIVCLIISYIEKKERWMTAGWIILILTGLISLLFNLYINKTAGQDNRVDSLITSGWQCATGAALAAGAFFFQRLNNRYFKILGILTVVYFMLVFFQFNSLMRYRSKVKPPTEQKEQNIPGSFRTHTSERNFSSSNFAG